MEGKTETIRRKKLFEVEGEEKEANEDVEEKAMQRDNMSERKDSGKQ